MQQSVKDKWIVNHITWFLKIRHMTHKLSLRSQGSQSGYLWGTTNVLSHMTRPRSQSRPRRNPRRFEQENINLLQLHWRPSISTTTSTGTRLRNDILSERSNRHAYWFFRWDTTGRLPSLLSLSWIYRPNKPTALGLWYWYDPEAVQWWRDSSYTRLRCIVMISTICWQAEKWNYRYVHVLWSISHTDWEDNWISFCIEEGNGSNTTQRIRFYPAYRYLIELYFLPGNSNASGCNN